jgi:peptidyl-tRNA hydrolase ICT1
MVMDVYNHAVPGETSEEQHERVIKLQKASKEARLKSKHVHSSKKQSRRGPSE